MKAHDFVLVLADSVSSQILNASFEFLRFTFHA